jgi:hypothetical protein
MSGIAAAFGVSQALLHRGDRPAGVQRPARRRVDRPRDQAGVGDAGHDQREVRRLDALAQGRTELVVRDPDDRRAVPLSGEPRLAPHRLANRNLDVEPEPDVGRREGDPLAVQVDVDRLVRARCEPVGQDALGLGPGHRAEVDTEHDGAAGHVTDVGVSG